MQLYPAIDLMAGAVVRLRQGDFAQRTDYPSDPVALAQAYQKAGATWLHLVDLDGAKNADTSGAAPNLDVLQTIAAQTTLQIQTGGGVRTHSDVAQRFALGAQRVVIGSLAVKDPALAQSWISEFGADRICLALDARIDDQGIYRVHVSGWRTAAAADVYDLLQQFAAAGLAHALITDIDRDGMLAGPNVALYRSLRAHFPGVALQASGGVSSLDDLRMLRGGGIAGAVIGKALLEGRFDLNQAMTC